MSQERISELTDRMRRRQLAVGVIGLGYVGLPLATSFAAAGFHVTGFDVDGERVATLNKGHSHIADVASDEFRLLVDRGAFEATSDFSRLAGMDAVSICVPTPLRKTKDPDVSFIITAVDRIAETLRPGQLIVLESTTYPGTTEELVLPKLQATGLKVGSDFWLAFSPERIDPGNSRFHLGNTPKVIGGVTPACTELASGLYGTIVDQIVPVSTTRAAELVKLLENTFRAVNIGLANEVAQMATVLGVDVWEVIAAAATKPFGFVPFYPGPGLGGHCIPIDPHYLAWKLRALNYQARFIELASQVNGEMPAFVVEQVTLALNEAGKCLNGARILVLGVTYKADVRDVRESPALDIIELLQERRAQVSFADPYVDVVELAHGSMEGIVPDEETYADVDAVVIVTDHHSVDYASVVRRAPLVIDTRNVTAGLTGAARIWRLGGENRA